MDDKDFNTSQIGSNRRCGSPPSRMLLVFVLCCGFLVPLASVAQEKSKDRQKVEAKKTTTSEKAITRGSKLFSTHCASCHAEGGNRITPSKPVKNSQVLSTMATFKSYLNEPVGNMPHYEHLIRDEKLLGDLYAYTKELGNKKTVAPDEKTKKEKKSLP